METMPVSFRKNFSKCVTIIDCFEVFIERPTSIKARAQTLSNYKHHNTVKFLIRIAPQGVVTFISKRWGVNLTENRGMLDKLSPGNLILADTGCSNPSTSIWVSTPLFEASSLQDELS